MRYVCIKFKNKTLLYVSLGIFSHLISAIFILDFDVPTFLCFVLFCFAFFFLILFVLFIFHYLLYHQPYT
jgi:hypothetical protein